MSTTEEKRLHGRWRELPWLYKVQLCSYFIAGTCGAVAYPLTTKLIYSSVNVDTISSRLAIAAVIGLALSIAWLTIQERLFKWFVCFTVTEALSYTLLVVYAVNSSNYDAYMIWSAIIGATIGHIVNGGGQKLHQKITDNEQYRTDYCFFTEVASSLGLILGSAANLLFGITDTALAFGLLLVSLIGFSVTDIYVYNKVYQKPDAE